MRWFGGNVPARENESCSEAISALEERVEKLELASAERTLQVMDWAEKISFRLSERITKRSKKPEENGDDLDRLIAVRRGNYGLR
jgi:hypothetical protein